MCMQVLTLLPAGVRSIQLLSQCTSLCTWSAAPPLLIHFFTLGVPLYTCKKSICWVQCIRSYPKHQPILFPPHIISQNWWIHCMDGCHCSETLYCSSVLLTQGFNTAICWVQSSLCNHQEWFCYLPFMHLLSKTKCQCDDRHIFRSPFSILVLQHFHIQGNPSDKDSLSRNLQITSCVLKNPDPIL